MKVLKFGGTSVGTVNSLTNVKRIVEEIPGRKVVVVSALGGITDLLIATARLAVADDIAYLDSYARIVERHIAVIDGVVPESRRDATLAMVKMMLDELGNIFKGVMLLHDLSPRALDIIVSYGERLSSVIVSNAIKGATHFDSRTFIRTKEGPHGANVLDSELTNRLIEEKVCAYEWDTAVMGGFLATDAKGEVTNLGRGGSDYTAAIMAAALDADILEIWTDVDGFMTADPRVIDTAYVIDELTYTEAMELCNFGAKVIYPPTIYPVYHKNIPILVKNTFNPSAPGTRISNEPPHRKPSDKAIKGISSINDTCLVTITSLCMVGVIGVNSRIFNALTAKGVSVFLVSQAASENNTTIAVRNADADLAVRTLREEFATELATGMFNDVVAERDLATVAVVGENMKHTTGLAGKLFNTVGRNGINVIACAQGASETNISFVIERKSLRKALNVIHDSFFLSECQVLNLFLIGVGNVGRSLMQQISKQQEKLLREKNLRINVVGIASSKRGVFNRDGLDVADWRRLLDEEGIDVTPDIIRREVLNMNIFNSVFVDCTASADVAALYKDLLSHNVNVVAANKIAASGDYDVYKELKETARRKDVKYLFETNVGAGLPIINTINSLINSGDKILKIEAVVSGTLNYIFNVLAADVPLSRAVVMAKEAGYTEPDPRIDLSGKDVIRKLVILAREAGYEVSQEDVEKNLFIPEEMLAGEADEFISKVASLDEEFEKMRGDAEAAHRHFRFVASFDNGHLSVGLRSVDSDHPFYNLAGSNNVILLTTDRYMEYPMVIKGYGAGAEVTAAGVFADIISIANIR
ncbi:bifunctional aspartate kinase/homoserine dehydrogenase I [Lepagella muris]|jgi:aspartokinase/homoserine dehydrogenase 1|uniref:Bifunctional aspartate kinase/homoserine dehydrogenase I n=1 Tax=Lepagella muris TaxID=3032870 RepID=A0AC61RBA2_9BACT|nr:bifunctional aspartate kinase/homoserine dehydrogenase I [Lepagella muris]ROT03086.1 bifunctional aspartate kinase/homoserine dehydrogenase I [Muribaculaceae bacterium Isolate-037 (Harlan)]TGY75555.1 bifunctional aspartate kinase/homoserine dehydrogenase I [Lepagella muris]THG46603.1 bifunctional aspartate kinase/homoserine dehydrogenase I [Bacteroidales bacterium]TKC54182.1 bifunctional aspartate kinase/homoserine dehydrogenase I [Bacteroidales bacterium]